MNEHLVEKAKEWMQLERKTLEQRRIAEEYYANQLMELIEDDFIERNIDKVYEKVDYLVVSVGTSYEPIVLNIQLFQPKRILFLYTATTEKTLGKIVNYCKLEPMEYEKSQVSEVNPLDIYREIKHSYLKWEKPSRMYIDFTGGTKAMSAAAAMAGALINVQLVYVGTNDYLTDFRKPNPGTETLFYINNPLAIFGDLEIEKAMTLFGEFNYAGAQEKLEILKESIPDPNIRQQLNFVYLLAKSYEHWDALDFKPAYDFMKKLNMEIKRDRMCHQTFLLMDFADVFERQENMLKNLCQIPELVKNKENMKILKNKETIITLMFTMYQNAMIREHQEKYDMATLLLYRLLEMIEQRRLAHYELYVSKMDYLNIKYDFKRTPEFKGKDNLQSLEILKDKVLNIKTEIFGKAVSNYLPEQVSLLEGFIILSALGDQIVIETKGKSIDKLKKIRSMVFLRNNSIFAHGLGPVGVSDFMKFKKFVLDLFGEFCKIEKISMSEMTKYIEFVNPMDSKNYSSGFGEE